MDQLRLAAMLQRLNMHVCVCYLGFYSANSIYLSLDQAHRKESVNQLGRLKQCSGAATKSEETGDRKLKC